jgi:hypothetical protein
MEAIMKRLFLCVPVLAMLFFSCSTSAGVVYDESVPLEESSWINIGNLGTVTGYNGIAVNWKLRGYKMVQIPAGSTLLEVDVYSQLGNTIYQGKGLIFAYNFQPGKQYFISVGREEVSKELGLRIYAYDFGEKLSASQSAFEAHFESYVPFLNAQNSGGTTVLN